MSKGGPGSQTYPRFEKKITVLVTISLFAAGICMGIGGAFVWAWAVRSGQLRDLERTKEQLFWPDVAPRNDSPSRKP
jgi:cbb3-type cytochrome oxidase maturation protein